MEVGGQRHTTATSTLGRRLGTHFIGGWVRLRSCVDFCSETTHNLHVMSLRTYVILNLVYSKIHMK